MRYGQHVTRYQMPKITKGAEWMTDEELLQAIATLEDYNAPTRQIETVKNDRLARLYDTLTIRLRQKG